LQNIGRFSSELEDSCITTLMFHDAILGSLHIAEI